MKRKCGEIKWVRLSKKNHFGGKKPKLKGSAYQGVRYETAFDDYMKGHYSEVLVHPWLEWEDENGYGLCQPDLVLLDPFVVFECKVTFTYRKAYRELRTLYAPLVVRLWEDRGLPKMVQVCRHLKSSARNTTVARTFEEVIKSDKQILTWNWRPL